MSSFATSFFALLCIACCASASSDLSKVDGYYVTQEPGDCPCTMSVQFFGGSTLISVTTVCPGPATDACNVANAGTVAFEATPYNLTTADGTLSGSTNLLTTATSYIYPNITHDTAVGDASAATFALSPDGNTLQWWWAADTVVPPKPANDNMYILKRYVAPVPAIQGSFVCEIMAPGTPTQLEPITIRGLEWFSFIHPGTKNLFRGFIDVDANASTVLLTFISPASANFPSPTAGTQHLSFKVVDPDVVMYWSYANGTVAPPVGGDSTTTSYKFVRV